MQTNPPNYKVFNEKFQQEFKPVTSINSHEEKKSFNDWTIRKLKNSKKELFNGFRFGIIQIMIYDVPFY